MTRITTVWLLLGVAAALLSGCNREPPPKPFGAYSIAELEDFMANKSNRVGAIRLGEFSLDPTEEDGRYVGTCVNDDGLQFEVEVVQESARITWKAVHKGITLSGSESQ